MRGEWETHWWRLEVVPDAEDPALQRQGAQQGLGLVFAACEQLVRTIARFSASDLIASWVLEHEPERGARDGRLRSRWYLRLSAGPSVHASTLARLVDSGVGLCLRLRRCADDEVPSRSEWGAVGVVCGREQCARPLVDPLLNPLVARVPVYHAVRPLEPRSENVWDRVDALLDLIDTPCRIEIAFAPVRASVLREQLFERLALLRRINAWDAGTALSELGGDAILTRLADAPRRGWDAEQPVHERDPLADEFATAVQETHRRFGDTIGRFALRVFVDDIDSARAVAAAVGESAFEDGEFDVLLAQRTTHPEWVRWAVEQSEAHRIDVDEPGPRPTDEEDGVPWETLRDARRLCHVSTAASLAGAFRPAGTAGFSGRTWRSAGDPPSLRDPLGEGTGALLGFDLESARAPIDTRRASTFEALRDHLRGSPCIDLPFDLLPKHAFIAGVPGSGKTTAVFHLLVQLWRAGIPFLVLETAKTEYRVLKTLTDHPDPDVARLARCLHVYTPGNDDLNPMRFNPLEYDKDAVSLDEHLESIQQVLQAGLPDMGDGPLPVLLVDALERLYRQSEDRAQAAKHAQRSRPTEEVPPPPPPMLADLLKTALEVLEEADYQGEIGSNLRAALLLRIGSLTRRNLGRLFNTSESVPSADRLLEYPMIIEVEHAGASTAGLLSLMLLNRIRQLLRVAPPLPEGRRLRHVIVIEEAHNLLGGGDASSPATRHASEFITRMLAEVRALGEGIVIADQLPTGITPEVIKNTSTKIIGRLVSEDDRKEIAASMLMTPEQTDELARLEVGGAFVFREGFFRARRMVGVNAHALLQLEGRAIPGRALRDVLRGDPTVVAGARIVRRQLKVAFDQWLEAGAEKIDALLDGFERARWGEDAPGTSVDRATRAEQIAWSKKVDALGAEFERTWAALHSESAQRRSWLRAVAGDHPDLCHEATVLDAWYTTTLCAPENQLHRILHEQTVDLVAHLRTFTHAPTPRHG